MRTRKVGAYQRTSRMAVFLDAQDLARAPMLSQKHSPETVRTCGPHEFWEENYDRQLLD